MIENNCYSLEWIGTARCLWRYTVRETNESFDIAPPVFEIKGETMPFVPADIALSREPVTLPNGVTTYTYTASFATDPDLVLDVVFRVAPDNSVVRFQYRLTGAPGRTLTKSSGDHNTAYLGLSLDDFPACTEVRVSEFDEAIHSFRPTEHPIPLRAFAHALTLMGPIVIAQDDEHALLVAYEHGSQVPDAFLQYQ
jgi:alpha-galactosidase